MRKSCGNLFGSFIDPFLDYLAPQTENSLTLESEKTAVKEASFDSEKLCLLIFVFALVFVASISPILCFGSLLLELSLEGMWYFWLITLADTGFLVWRLARRLGKRKTIILKSLDNRAKCNILKLYDLSDTTKKITEFGGLYYAQES